MTPHQSVAVILTLCALGFSNGSAYAAQGQRYEEIPRVSSYSVPKPAPKPSQNPANVQQNNQGIKPFPKFPGGSLGGMGGASQAPSRPPVQPSAPSSPVPVGEEDPAAEVMKDTEKWRQTYGAVNAANPTSAEFDPNKALPPGFEQIEKIQKLLSHPAVQAYLKLFQNEKIMQGAERVMKHPKKKELLWFELGCFIFMVIFRAWRISKCNHWLQRLSVTTYTFILYWVMAIVIVPGAVLGQGYLDMLQGLYETGIKYLDESSRAAAREPKPEPITSPTPPAPGNRSVGDEG